MKPSRQAIVYLVGVMLLGFFYEPVSSALGGEWLFVGCVLVYLVALRWIGTLIAKRAPE
jgi:hypothetical protein